MKMKRQLLNAWLMGLFFLLAIPVWAQTAHISGVVLSADDKQPVAGASIKVNNTGKEAQTDDKGRFSIEAKAGDVLTVSFIGMTDATQTVSGEGLQTILLKAMNADLDEVVVIGYGVQKKKLVTGANVQVGGDILQKQAQVSPLQAMQGKAAGVAISSTSGQPGADMKVTIRGLGTIGNSGPLYVIDGVPGDITLLNAADIQSIDVLKDAASAAIYGSQAGNGVVLVTTKSGRQGKGQLSFDGYTGIQDVRRKTNLLNADQYKVIMNEQSLNSGGNPIDFGSMEGLANTNWLDYMIKDNAKTDNYSLNVNGGSETSMYAISLNYTGQEGIIGGKAVSDYQRYGFRINTEQNLYGNVLKVGQHLNFNYIKNNGIGVGNQYNNTLRAAFNTSPLSLVYSDNNIYDSPYNDTQNSPWYNGDGNPYGMMMTNSNNTNSAQKLMADVYAELEPIKNLKLRSTFGVNYGAGDYRSFTPLYHFSAYTYNDDHTTTSQNMSRDLTLTWINTASYDFRVRDDHAFSAMIGTEAIRYQGSYLSGSNWNLLSQFNDFAHAYLDNTTGQAHLDDDGNIVQTITVSGKPQFQNRRASYFARLSYNYQEKYLFNGTIRADGSSKFASGHQEGYFPSVSGGWVISNESFAANTKGWLDYLKLRASWGQVGNQDIPDFQFTSPINTSTGYTADNPAAYYNFGTALTNVPGAYPSRLSNPNLTWETSEQTDVGLDARFLKSRLELNADFYIKTTKDWLVLAPILATAGAGAPYVNGGSVKNTGVELALAWNDHVGDFNYHLSVNGAYNKNKVGEIPTQDGIIHGLTAMLYDNSEEFYRAQNGFPIGYFWGYKTAGIFQSEQDITAWKAAGNGILQANVRPGDVKYVDQQHDGVINSDDKVSLGSGMPNVTFGFNIGFDYKNFDLSINAYGAMGNKIVQSYRNQANSNANYTTAILDRWTGEGTSNRIPRVTNTNINWQFSDLYVHDGDYLKISNITLGYDFSKLVRWKYLSQTRLFIQAQNPFIFTKYDGMDPEIGYGTEGWVSGVDLGYYPRPTSYLLGLSLKF